MFLLLLFQCSHRPRTRINGQIFCKALLQTHPIFLPQQQTGNPNLEGIDEQDVCLPRRPAVSNVVNRLATNILALPTMKNEAKCAGCNECSKT